MQKVVALVACLASRGDLCNVRGANMQDTDDLRQLLLNGPMDVPSSLQALAMLVLVTGHRAQGWHSRCHGVKLSMDEDAIKQKLAAVRKRSGRRPVRTQTVPDAAEASKAEIASALENCARSSLASQSLPEKLPGMLDAPVWTVPGTLRMPSSQPCAPVEHGYYVSLDSLFPGTGLGDAWDTVGSLRTALRRALREDLMAPLLSPKMSDHVREEILSLNGGCMISWSNALDAHAQGKISLNSFTDAFRKYGVKNLDGAAFVRIMGSLCGDRPHGSLIDIIPLNRTVAHSWHQDTGIPQNTAVLGFPPEDGYVGGGVFSHFVKLSHPLRPSSGEQHGEVVQFEALSDPPLAIPEEFIFRPLYSKDREVWVYNDAATIHSTPDRQRRECLWRFM